jgi:hypothetical protein
MNARTTRRWTSELVFATLMLAAPFIACGGDDGPAQERCTTQRCRYNSKTGAYDFDCQFIGPDGGPEACDGGVDQK